MDFAVKRILYCVARDYRGVFGQAMADVGSTRRTLRVRVMFSYFVDYVHRMALPPFESFQYSKVFIFV